MDIYVGNLPYTVDDGELGDIFAAHGNVEKAKVVMDRETGRSKGFGFVTMSDASEAEAAIEALDGLAISGRNLRVNEARPRSEEGGGGGGGGGGRRR